MNMAQLMKEVERESPNPNQYVKTLVISTTSGKQVFENQWVNKKGRYGKMFRFEILKIYEEDETARVRYLTDDDGYLYLTQTFHKLGLKRVML